MQRKNAEKNHEKKQRLKQYRIVRALFYFFLGSVAITLCAIAPISMYILISDLPHPNLLKHRHVPKTTKLFDRNGILLYEIFDEENRTPIPLSSIPDTVKNAVVAIEDKDFYTHQGFSVSGIIRAIRETILYNQLQGGSTITQQLIKSTLLTSEISLERKIKELILAYWTERLYTKEQILEMYLNEVSFGGTAWGIESASQTYFGKSVKHLTLAEAAFLAGLPQSPSLYSPFSGNKEKAIERQHHVLRRMVEDGYITEEQAQEAKQQPLIFIQPKISIQAPHFVWYVKDYLERWYGKALVKLGGLRVVTTLDLPLQQQIESIVANNIKMLANLQVTNGAAIVTNPKTGEILAMVGSKNYFDTENDGNVNVTTSLRQPGSSIKVVTYAKAIEDKKITAATILEDLPVSYSIPGQPPYRPVNYDGRFHGLVPTRLALGNSYNIPAVRVLHMIGVDAMIAQGERMGIDTWKERNRFGLSLTLGGGEVTMIDMAEVYGALANLGTRVDLTPIRSIEDYKGISLSIQKPSPVQALSPETAWIITNILSDNWARTQAFGSNSKLVIPGKTVAVKTGTTDQKRDNWTIGYTPSYVVAVWVGNNDNRPMHPYLTSGVTGAAPIWHDIMKKLLEDKPDEIQPKPEQVIAFPCYGNRVEYFIRGTEPRYGCGLSPTPTPQQHNQLQQNTKQKKTRD